MKHHRDVHLHAEVVHEQVHANGVVLARSILAHADIHLTVHPAPSFRAYALETTHFISTRCAVQTRIRRAIVYVDFTGRSGVAFATVANEGVVEIYATIGADRIARIAQTLVNLCLALQPDEAGSAPTDEALQLVYACGSVLARIRRAIIDRVLALLACVTGLASAGIVIDLVDALAVVSAWFRRALVDVRLAGCTGPSRMADALVAKELVHADSV